MDAAAAPEAVKRPLRVYGVSGFDLFVTRCRACGHLTVHGFWGQLKLKVWDAPRRVVTLVLHCEKCNRARVKRYRLTAGRAHRHRLVRWDRLFWRAVPYLPLRLWRPLGRAALWLEMRFPI